MKKATLTLVLVMAVFSLSAQKIVKKSGDIKALKGQETIELSLTFEDMKVGKLSEAEYIEKKKTDANNRDGDGGKRWEEGWISDRTERFEPKFIELFNKYCSAVKIAEEGSNSAYLMIFNTYFTEPGFNVGVASKPAYISATLKIVEKENPDKVIAEFDIIDARGLGSYDFDSGYRLQEAYAKAGKGFGSYLGKALK